MATDHKPPRPKSKFLQFLPKAAAALTFHNNHHPPFSPGRAKSTLESGSKFKSHVSRRLAAPIISLIPAEARQKSKNSSFRAEEPTSPRVSCMGQIQHHRHKNNKKIVTKIPKKSLSLPKDIRPYAPSSDRRRSAIGKILAGGKSGKKPDSSAKKSSQVPDRAPSLGQMKMFVSGRDKFAGFDWTAQIAPVDSDHHNHRNYFSDEEREDSERDDEEDDDVIIPFSAPIMMTGGGKDIISLEPKKEINLWKRRTMAQPKPLKLNIL